MAMWYNYRNIGRNMAGSIQKTIFFFAICIQAEIDDNITVAVA
jgi:hypothetical protein